MCAYTQNVDLFCLEVEESTLYLQLDFDWNSSAGIRLLNLIKGSKSTAKTEADIKNNYSSYPTMWLLPGCKVLQMPVSSRQTVVEWLQGVKMPSAAGFKAADMLSFEDSRQCKLLCCYRKARLLKSSILAVKPFVPQPMRISQPSGFQRYKPTRNPPRLIMPRHQGRALFYVTKDFRDTLQTSGGLMQPKSKSRAMIILSS